MERRICSASWALTLCLLGAPALAAPCAPPSSNPVQTLRAMYAAAMKGDRQGVLDQFAPDFYAFDGGKRYSGPELADLVKVLRAHHLTYVWTVNDPDTHLACGLAWLTYVNRGSMTDSAGTHPLSWLESSVLTWNGHAWKMAFFHSTRIPASKP